MTAKKTSKNYHLISAKTCLTNSILTTMIQVSTNHRGLEPNFQTKIGYGKQCIPQVILQPLKRAGFPSASAPSPSTLSRMSSGFLFSKTLLSRSPRRSLVSRARLSNSRHFFFDLISAFTCRNCSVNLFQCALCECNNNVCLAMCPLAPSNCIKVHPPTYFDSSNFATSASCAISNATHSDRSPYQGGSATHSVSGRRVCLSKRVCASFCDGI